MATHAVMRWLNDYNRLSVHSLKFVLEPAKPSVGTTGIAKYPGYPGLWQYRILKMGGQKEMTAWLDRNITNLTEDVLDTFLNVDENRNISDQTEDVSKTVNVDEKLKDQNIPETPKPKDKQSSSSISNFDQKIPETPKPKDKQSSSSISNFDQKIPETSKPKDKQSSSCISNFDQEIPETGETPKPKEKQSSSSISNFDQNILQTPKSSVSSCDELSDEEVGEKTSTIGKRRKFEDSKWEMMEDTIEHLKSDMRKLKRKMKTLEGQLLEKNVCTAEDQTNNELKEAVQLKSTWQGAVEVLVLSLFSQEDLKNQSVSGKRSAKCGADGPRPPMDPSKLTLLQDIVINKFPNEASRKGIVEKIQNMQKVLRRKAKV